MADIYKGELQDNNGNTIYPHTEADVVFCADGETTQEKLAKYEEGLGHVTGTTDSLEVDDSNILASSKALHKLNQSLTLDFSKSTMTSLNEFLQSALEKLYPLLEPLYIIKAGADKNGINIYKGTEQAQLSASVTFGTSYATLKTAYDSIMCVTSLVDFKGYKTLNITFEGAGHSTTKNAVRIGVSTSQTDGVMVKTLYSANNYTNIDKITKSIDISDISGEKYVSIYMSNTRTDKGEDKIYIYDLWLE